MVKQVAAMIETGEGPGSGTDGEVYLGLGGREFACAIKGYDDFEEGDSATYVFGEEANVENPELNDPRHMRSVSMSDVQRFPVYLRFQPRSGRDNWHLSGITVKVYGTSGAVLEYSALPQGEYLWLGYRSGLYCHLKPTA